MELKIPATEETRKSLEDIKAKSIELVAALQLLEVEIQSVLLKDQESMQFGQYVVGFDFDTNEFIANVPEIDIGTEEGKKILASVLGVDEVVGIVTP